MTKEEIIRMAESVSINFANRSDESTLIEFAELVAQHERDACSGVCLDEVARLRHVIRNVYEVWAGSDGVPLPETAAEAYLLQLVEQMRDEAKNGLHNCSSTTKEPT